MNYIELYIKCSSDFAEILMAELAEIGFESFTEEIDGLKGYIAEDKLIKKEVEGIFEKYHGVFDYEISEQTITKQNWNETWEQNYEPIYVANQVQVRASFHTALPNYTYDIIINPKMSFGTGHHETTSQMMTQQLQLDFQNKKVLDIGCGTGILAILAEKLGATKILAFDIEEWAAKNSVENTQLNDCKHIIVHQGTIENEKIEPYDIVLANINRNILLRDIAQYVRYMKAGSKLLVSGFYTNDQPEIENQFSTFGLKKINESSKNNWACVAFTLA